MEKSDNKDTPEKDKSQFFVKVIDIITFPIAALAGYWNAHTIVRDDAQEIAKKPGLFLSGIFNKYQEERVHNDQLREAGEITAQKWRELDKASRKAYRTALDTKMEEHGLGSFMSKWNYISRSDRQKALIGGLEVGMIAIGALLSIANSKTLSHWFGAHNQSDKDPSL